MAAELLDKLVSRLTGNRITPARIEKYLCEVGQRAGMRGKIKGELPSVLLSEFQLHQNFRQESADANALRTKLWYRCHQPVVASRNNKSGR